MPKVIPATEYITDFEDVQATVSINKNTTANVILKLVTKNALVGYLAFVGEAWDAAIDGAVTWRVKKDGGTIYQLKDSTVQIAAPEQPQNEISPWLPLPQQTTLTFEADLNNAAATPASGNVTARFRVYYAPVDSGLK